MTSTIFRTALLAGAAAAALVAMPAFAQSSEPAESAAPAQDEEVNDDIVVTAQFREQRVQDTPLAITAIDADLLESRGQLSVVDVAAQAPNVTLRPATATFGPSIQAFIRGVGQYDSSYAFEPGVGLYVDDVYYPTLTGSIVDLVDLDRIEVLRGPQGTLSGQNSIGGSIKIYSKKPDGQGGGFVQATYGRFNRVEVRGAMDFALVPDKLFVRLTGTGVSKDGYVTRYDYACTHPGTTVPSFQNAVSDCKLGTQGGKSYAAARAALRWVPSDRLEINVIGDYTNDSSEAAPSTLLFVGNQAGVPGVPNNTSAYQIGGVALGNATGSPFITYSPYGNYAQDTYTNSPYVNYATYVNPAPRDGTAPYTVADRNAINGWGVSGTIDYELADNLSIKSITAYRSYVTRYIFDEGSPVDTALIDNYNRLEQVSQEVRISGKIADAVNFTVGGFYFQYDATARQRVDIPSLQFIQDDKISQSTRAVFANAEWAIVPGLDVVGGIRYTSASKTVTYGRRGIPGSIFGGLPDPRIRALDGVVGEHKSDNWDFRGALQYRWSPEVMTYAQVSTGFKIGGVNPRAFFPQQALPFGPEKLTAYEIGVKTDLFDRRVRFNLSGFYNKYRDILIVVSSCPLPGVPAAPCALPVNAGRATVQGLEAETTVKLAKGLTFDGSVAYLDFDYTSLSAAAIASGVTPSMRGPFTPEWQYSAGVQYEAEFGSGGTLTPRLDVAHVGSFYQQASNAALNEVPGRTLLNASITWRSPSRDWSVALHITNVTDELYYNSVFDNRGSNSTVTGFPGTPREWAVTVKRTF
ncbi:TonB-dependent receptor [Sphingomonas sp. G-3-2-10]|uniref:TonB-dependent receptor n=1 Tax=Sphingomonas sp. G-3-2-10 TaxID=2728838 RepID=UPI00146B7DE9|nr:TonB-dependent receptor [Sphingomonas sp. G-3-2-10]NML07458.1 TonB-dependent receptor [Sphingomonas sp. G-3-2-10]